MNNTSKDPILFLALCLLPRQRAFLLIMLCERMERSRMHRRIMVTVFLCSILCLHGAWADRYPDHPVRSDEGKGLPVCRIDSVGMEDHRPTPAKGRDFTPEKVKLDLVGWSVGPEAVVRVRSGAPGSRGGASGPSAGAHGNTSCDVYVPVPLGIVFDRTNIMDIEIVDVKKDGDKATLIVHVGTVSSHAGKLRLDYEHVVDEWILQRIENLSFRAQ